MNNSPAFQWYPKDILASARVAEMTLEEEGAYRRALDFCWLNGSLPADPERLAKLIGKGASILVATVVQAMFVSDANDPSKLVHERLEIERKKQEIWRGKSSEGGKKSAKVRQQKKIQAMKGASNLVATKPQPKGNSSSSSSSSSLSLKRESEQRQKNARSLRIPEDFTLSDEMRDWARKRAPNIDIDNETEKFVDLYTALTDDNPKSQSNDWHRVWKLWINLALERSNKNETQNAAETNYRPPKPAAEVGRERKEIERRQQERYRDGTAPKPEDFFKTVVKSS